MKVHEKIARLRSPIPATIEKEISILETIPQGWEAPAVSNVMLHPKYYGDPDACLSFSRPPYDPDKKWNPEVILSRLLDTGWEMEPLVMCKFDNYRPSPLFGAMTEIAAGLHRYELKTMRDMGNVWVSHSYHTGSEYCMFMVSPNDMVLRVTIDARYPDPVNTWAHRIEHQGGWRYGGGTGKISVPESWQEIGEIMRSEVWVSEHSVDGRVWWQDNDDEELAFQLMQGADDAH